MQTQNSRSCRYWSDETLFTDDLSQCFDIEYWQKKNAVLGYATGRGKTWFVQTSSLIAALRHYRRGGLWGKCVKDSYVFLGWERTRAAEEFHLLQTLHQKGLPVPRPLAARVIKSGMIYRADLIVEKIPDARDLVDCLEDHGLDENAYYEIGCTIAGLHHAQVCHSDLNIHNILLDSANKPWLIDFDKCAIKAGDGWKVDNLARLLRSFRKEKNKRNIQWQESDWQPLLEGYNSFQPNQ